MGFLVFGVKGLDPSARVVASGLKGEEKTLYQPGSHEGKIF
jgi:hypothetical protein